MLHRSWYNVPPLLHRRRGSFSTIASEGTILKEPTPPPSGNRYMGLAVEPGSVKLPPRPPLWNMAYRLGTIGIELGAMRLRLARGVAVDIRGRKMRETFIRLGPAFVKAGQALATRPDVGFPPEVCEELAKLQDQMPPFPTRDARRVIEQELGAKIEDLFDEFGEEPVAAASLGQVFRARLKNTKEDVAVKVQRPGLESVVTLDAHVFRVVAAALQASFGTNSNLVGVTDQLVGRVVEEIDFRNEASFAARFGDLYRSEAVAVPRIVPHLCSRKVLTMEWIDGVPLAHLAAASASRKASASAASAAAASARASGDGAASTRLGRTDNALGASTLAGNASTHSGGGGGSSSSGGASREMSKAKHKLDAVYELDPGPIIEVGVKCSLNQLLENGFYHGDPHPGNLMVTPEGKLAYLDFGMMGTLDRKTRLDVVRLLVNFVNRDEKGLAADLLSLGFLHASTPQHLVEEALLTVFQQQQQKQQTQQTQQKQHGQMGEADARKERRKGKSAQALEQEEDEASSSGSSRKTARSASIDDASTIASTAAANTTNASSTSTSTSNSRRFDFQGILLEMGSVMRDFQFHVPPHFALVIRALGAMEGTVIRVDPNFKVVARAYPHVVAQLIRDRSPEMRSILASLLVEQPAGRVRWSRLKRLLDPSAALQSGSGSSSDDDVEDGAQGGGGSLDESNPSAAAAASLISSIDLASATDDALQYLLSPEGHTLRLGLLQDGLDAVDSFVGSAAAAVVRRERQQQQRQQQQHEASSFSTSPPRPPPLLSSATSSAFSAAASLLSSAPGPWSGVASRVATSPEAHRLAAEFAGRAVEASSWRVAEWALAVGGKALREDQRRWQQQRKQQRQQHQPQDSQEAEEEKEEGAAELKHEHHQQSHDPLPK